MREFSLDTSVFLRRERRGRRMGDGELWLLREWRELDAFLSVSEVALQEFDAMGMVHVLDGSTFSGHIVALVDVWARATSEELSADSLWFIVATYLEAKKSVPRRWSELSLQDAEHLAFMLDVEPQQGSSFVSPRQRVVLYLRSRKGRGPEWYRPIPEA